MIDWHVPSMAVVVADEPGIIDVTEHVGPGMKCPSTDTLMLISMRPVAHEMRCDEIILQ